MTTATLGNILDADTKHKLQRCLDKADIDLQDLEDDWLGVKIGKSDFDINIWVQDGKLLASAYRVVGRFTDVTESFPLDVTVVKAANTQKSLSEIKARIEELEVWFDERPETEGHEADYTEFLEMNTLKGLIEFKPKAVPSTRNAAPTH